MKNILLGKSVRLSAVDHEEMGKAASHAVRDSELDRLMDSKAASLRSPKATTQSIEKELGEESASTFYFSIRSTADNALLGDIALDVDEWNTGNAFVGLAVYERANWGKGFGSEAMHLLLEFAFNEVNMRRVSLTVFEYNPRAIRSYEKVGFRHEGRLRGRLMREGKRWDMLVMGILREEWIALNGSANG